MYPSHHPVMDDHYLVMKPMVTGDAPIDQPSKWLRFLLRRGFCYTAIRRDIWPTELQFQAGFLMCDFTHVGCLPLKSGYQTKFKQKTNFQKRNQSGWSWTTQLNKLIDLSVAGFRNQGFRAESRSPQIFWDGAYLAVWDSQSYWNLLRKIIGWRIHHFSRFYGSLHGSFRDFPNDDSSSPSWDGSWLGLMIF